MRHDSSHIRRECIRVALVPKILLGIEGDHIESLPRQRSTEVLAEGIPTAISGNVENKSFWNPRCPNFGQGKGRDVRLSKYGQGYGEKYQRQAKAQFFQIHRCLSHA